MPRRVVAGDFLSGDILIDVPASTCAWRMRHRAGGDLSATVVWSSVRPSRAWDLYNALEPWKCYLAVIEDSPLTGDSYVLAAGPITGGSYSLDSDVLTVPAASMEKYLALRTLVAASALANPAAWAETLTSVSLGDIVRRYVQLAVGHTAGDPPIVLPSAEGGSLSKEIQGFNLASVWSSVEDIMKLTSGPDVALEPQIRADRLGIEWVMRTGTTAEPMLTQAGADWVWDASVRKGNVANVTTNPDASTMATRAWAIGQGTGPGVLLAHADDPTQLGIGFPLVEQQVNYSDEADASVLADHATADQAALSRPFLTWQFVARANQAPVLGRYRPGDWAKLYVKGKSARRSPYLYHRAPEGFHRSRIVEVAGDMGDNVTIALASQREDR